MNIRTMSQVSFYTQSQRCAAKIFLAVWLLTSCSTDIALAAPESERAMSNENTANAPDQSAPWTLRPSPDSRPAMERALGPLSQRASSLLPRTIDKLENHFERPSSLEDPGWACSKKY
ncbi:MAG: hypothetical protein AAF400_03085 [Bacteroidota bacterium]